MDVSISGNIERRHSCEFTKTFAFCINKAKVNLIKLQQSLQELENNGFNYEFLNVKKTEDGLKERSRKLSTAKNEKRLQPINSGTALEVCGSQYGTESNDIDEDVLKNGAMQEKSIQSVNSFFNLLNNLERECKSWESLLEDERKKSVSLHEKINWHAHDRVKRLKIAVQNEHESCAYDVQELMWHCTYEGRMRHVLQENVHGKERINKKLKEEIEFIKFNSPCIEDKLYSVYESVDVIQSKQKTADKEFESVKSTFTSERDDFQKSQRQLESDKQARIQRLSSFTQKLNTNLQILLNAQKNFQQMVSVIEESQAKEKKCFDDMELKDKKLAQVLQEEKELEQMLLDIDEEEKEQMKLCESLLGEINICGEAQSTEEIRLQQQKEKNQKQLNEKTTKYQKLIIGSKTSRKEIADVKKRMQSCEKQKISDAKAVKRSYTEKEKVQADLQIIKEETDYTRLLHEKLLLKLDQEKAKSIDVEQRLNMKLETLRNMDKEEIRSRIVLQAKINADTTDFDKKRKSTEKRRAKMIKTNEDIIKGLETVQKHVDMLNSNYEEKCKAFSSLEKILAQIKDKYSETECNSCNKNKSLQTEKENLKEKLLSLEKSVNENRRLSSDLTKKLQNTISSSVMMNKLLLSNQTTINDLREEVGELDLQIEAGQKLTSTLNESLNELKERLLKQTENHESQLVSRNQTLSLTKNILDSSLMENQMLAECYIEWLTQHIHDKNTFVNTFERSTLTHESLNDAKGLCEFHTQLNEALKCYYLIRGLQTKSGIENFKEVIRKNQNKLEDVYIHLQNGIKGITEYLNGQRVSKEAAG